MIFKTEVFRDVCSSILYAIDSSTLATITDTLELVTEGKCLYLNVTNQEYYVSYKFELDHEEEFHATVSATLFLKLIDKLTTEFVELQLQENNILVKANGNYKIPFVVEKEGQLLQLPPITINNVTNDFNIDYSILSSIADYNSKNLDTSSMAKDVHTMYYIDQQGCITHTKHNACVNTFTLASDVKFLLNNRIVKLFKLFKNCQTVNFKLGYDPLTETIIQTKVSFTSDKIKLTAIIRSDDILLNKVPAAVIRGIADKSYPNKIILNTTEFLDAVSRLLLFNDSKLNAKPYSTFKFGIDGNLTIYDTNNNNYELISYQKGTELAGEYQMRVDLTDIKKIIENTDESIITLSCGDGKSGVISGLRVRNVFAEVKKESNTQKKDSNTQNTQTQNSQANN